MAEDPVSVQIVAPTPMPVEVVAGDASPSGSPRVQRQTTDPSLPAKTTFQEDLTTEGQRHINVMWERTQQVIAVSVTVMTLTVCAWIIAMGALELRLLAFTLLSNVFFLVVGTYFQRTNHTKTGGVGVKTADTR